MITSRWIRALALAPLLAAASLTAGCDDSPTDGDDDAAAVARARFTIGTNAVVMNRGSTTAVSGTFPAVIGSASQGFAVELQDASGASLNSTLDGDFEVRVTPRSPVVAFARTGAFAGTLTRLTVGNTTLDIDLVHDGDVVLGWDLPIIVP